MKKETLEEAAERAIKSGLFKDKTLFIAGAKWQAERMYSEGEIKAKLLDKFIEILKEREGGKFDDIFSYDDIYKTIFNTKL